MEMMTTPTVRTVLTSDHFKASMAGEPLLLPRCN
jgi:hypothetical protein